MTRETKATFRVDNQLIQHAPKLFGTRKPDAGVQLSLPGDFAPFGPFDYWATVALYSLLDQDNPTESVKTTMTELVEVLEFTKEASRSLGYETFPSDAYEMVEGALHRLFTVEVNLRGFWKGRGRSKQWVEYHGRILASFQYVYPEGMTPASSLPASKRRNVNRSRDLTDKAPPIYRATDGPRPVAIEYRFAPDMVEGLKGQRIGATVFPMKVFALRPKIGRSPTATRLLFWVIRQASPVIVRKVDGLANELDLDTKRVKRTREDLKAAFAMLKDAGVIDAFEVIERGDDGPVVSIKKAVAWHFGKAEAAILADPKEGESNP